MKTYKLLNPRKYVRWCEITEFEYGDEIYHANFPFQVYVKYETSVLQCVFEDRSAFYKTLKGAKSAVTKNQFSEGKAKFECK